MTDGLPDELARLVEERKVERKQRIPIGEIEAEARRQGKLD